MNDRCGITLAVDQGRTTGIYIKCFKIAVIQPNAFAVRAGYCQLTVNRLVLILKIRLLKLWFDD